MKILDDSIESKKKIKINISDEIIKLNKLKNEGIIN